MYIYFIHTSSLKSSNRFNIHLRKHRSFGGPAPVTEVTTCVDSLPASLGFEMRLHLKTEDKNKTYKIK